MLTDFRERRRKGGREIEGREGEREREREGEKKKERN